MEQRNRPKRATDWDQTDANTGLSIGCKTACEIIDGLNHHELHLFNAPRRDNPAITAGELIERYLSLKSQKGACNGAKSNPNDDDSNRLEDEEGEAFIGGVEGQKGINETAQTQRNIPFKDKSADGARTELWKFRQRKRLKESKV